MIVVNILIIGGAGYIGSQLSIELSSEHKITVLDKFIPQKIQQHFAIKGVKFKKGDVTNKKIFHNLLDNFDAIIHMAVMHEVTQGVRKRNCSSSFERLFRNNVFGAKNLLNAFEKSDVLQLINISSYYVYGSNVSLISEDTCPEPDTIRGISKLVVEKFCKLLFNKTGKNIVTLRLPILYGNSLNMRWESVPNKFVKNAITGKPIFVFSGGTQNRNFIHIKDCISAIKLALLNRNISGLEINIGGYDTISINHLASLVEKTAERYDISIKKVEIHRGGGEPTELVYDMKKARRLLEYSPKYSIEDSLGEMFDLGLKTFM
jgi:nucleoside-diphosphate-sugar epimerase